MGIKKGRTKGARKEPPWKQRQKKQIGELRKDISRLNCILRKEPIKWKVQVTLDHKYKTKEKGFQVFLKELKQRVTAKAAKRRRYENRVKQFWQNRLFDSDKTRLFEELDGKLEEKTPHQAPMKVQRFGAVYGLPISKEIRAIEKGETYKYLGVLEADEIKHEAIKGNIHTEYFTRVRSILKSKLSGGNVMRATNSRGVSIIRYGAGIINWTKEELRKMYRKTRKLLTIQVIYEKGRRRERFNKSGGLC